MVLFDWVETREVVAMQEMESGEKAMSTRTHNLKIIAHIHTTHTVNKRMARVPRSHPKTPEGL